MAVAVLVLWLCTAAVGSYLLATSTRSRNTSPAPPDPVSVSAEQPAAGQAAAPVSPDPARPVRAKDRFDPLSLQEAKAEPLPGIKDLAEFAHPTLAMIGFGFWFGYVVSRDRLFLAIAVGIMLGAILAGISWFTANTRAKRAAAARKAGATGQGADSDVGPLSVSTRLLVLHAVGAGLTLLIAALIAARV